MIQISQEMAKARRRKNQLRLFIERERYH